MCNRTIIIEEASFASLLLSCFKDQELLLAIPPDGGVGSTHNQAQEKYDLYIQPKSSII